MDLPRDMMRPVPTKTAMNSPASIPPYIRLANRLRSQIRDNALAPGDCIGTEVQLARESGLSRMTVRRAVQMLVDEGLVERRPGRGVFVRGADTATRSVLFLAGNLLWAPAVRVAQAVQSDAPDAGLDVSVFDARGDLDAFLAELRTLPESGAAGAIIMSQHDADFNRALAVLVAADYPFVVIDQALADLPAPSVAADNRAGGRFAAEALLAAGHRRFAFLGDLAADTTAARAQGVADACAAALVPPPAVFDIPGRRFADWEPAIRERIAEMLRVRPRPTALVCSCDAVALHAIRALSEAGHSVPRDLSVTGFDDDPIAEWASPALTTVRQDFAEMGHRAFAALVAQLGKAEAPESPAVPPAHEAVPVTLVERSSIAPPPRRRTAAHAVFSNRRQSTSIHRTQPQPEPQPVP